MTTNGEWTAEITNLDTTQYKVVGDSYYDVLHISTDIPLTMKNVKCTNVKVSVDDKQILELKEAFPNTQNKLAGFKNGYGTVLFFKDTDVVKGLQEQFELYADNFPDWSEQSNGIATANTWVALVDKGLGANLQHYNPVIDEAVAKEWNIPSNWKLRSQLVFGSPETPAGEKEYMNDADRFRVFG